ncbi:hypothetical protein HERIO_2792 [Hepatospora eriocheir]|uniref:Uncharacterized protein n=1 Tax=Hepatospora eriocheir TaxID=1081669 RepID=A0A1X0Q6D4_9MICR|nr:hypothetical protein HERIO_2792 [Hepatospora eriocheir]
MTKYFLLIGLIARMLQLKVIWLHQEDEEDLGSIHKVHTKPISKE